MDAEKYHKQLARAEDYIERHREIRVVLLVDEETGQEIPPDIDLAQAVPSLAGLADYLGVSYTTVVKWSEDERREEFADLVRRMLTKAMLLIQTGALNKTFQPTHATAMLNKIEARMARLDEIQARREKAASTDEDRKSIESGANVAYMEKFLSR